MLSFLIPFATPLFIIGLVVTAAIVLAGIITIIGRGDESPGSLQYAIFDARMKWLIKMLLISLGAIVLGWALPHTNADPSRPVPTKIVYVQPKPVEIYDNCIKHVQETDETRASCLRVAQTQMELVKRYTPTEVERKVYLIPRLPDLYQSCVDGWNAKDASWADVNKFNAQCENVAERQYSTMINKYKER